jgi:multicomponent Na+:H+ antiporter subunit G
MELFQEIFAVLAVVIGTIFSVLGVLGMIRMPDVYTRLHATGKVGVFGVVLILVAAGTQIPVGLGKVLILIISLMVSGPVAAHAIGSAAFRIGIPMVGEKAVVDKE